MTVLLCVAGSRLYLRERASRVILYGPLYIESVSPVLLEAGDIASFGQRPARLQE